MPRRRGGCSAGQPKISCEEVIEMMVKADLERLQPS